MSKGITVSHLLKSNVFCVGFDYDDWPSSHFNDASCLRPYDGSFFNLRYKYKELFPEEQYSSLDEL